MNRGGSETFGIYWSGGLTGSLRLGDAATEAPYYSPYAPTALLLDSGTGTSGWYNVNVEKIVINDAEFAGIDCTKHARACIIDTGTPTHLLPSELRSLLQIELSQQAKLEFHLEGARVSKASVILDFNLTKLMSEGLVGVLDPPQAFWDPLLVIGLPLWAHYYTMFNLTGDTVSFTRH